MHDNNVGGCNLGHNMFCLMILSDMFVDIIEEPIIFNVSVVLNHVITELFNSEH